MAALLVAQHVSAQAGSSAITGAAGINGSATVTQVGNLAIELLKVGQRDYPQASRVNLTVPIGKARCQEGTVTVLVRNLQGGNTLPYLEAWLATANNCEQGDRGSRASGTAECTKLNIPNAGERQVANRISYEVTVELGPTCDSEGVRPIYFLQLQSENSNATATSYGVLQLKVDITPPPVPAIPAGQMPVGQTVIPLNWTANTYDTVNYWVVADWGASTGIDIDAGTLDGGISGLSGVNPDCESQVVRANRGIDVDAFPLGIFSKHIEGGGKRSYDFDGTQFHDVKKVPAAVIAEDLAGNVSDMSEVVCLKVEKTTGFWAAYQKGVKDPVGDGCACSVPGAPGARRNALVALPVLLVLGWACARSRTRRRAR